ncbi:MAG: hypothetical protein KAI76_08450 [Alphaproteobacteria bacterium]|nr:hypothetical protein [Alphaproteobacteria bacterium]
MENVKTDTAQYKACDRNEKQILVNKQLVERGRLQDHIQQARKTHHQIMHELRQDIGGYKEMRKYSTHVQEQKQGMEM